MTALGRALAVAAMSLVAALAASSPASAVEYRLKLASIYDQSLTSFLSAGELGDGASGPGFQRLEAELDQGTIGRGVMITHRPLNSVPDTIARAWGGIAVQAPIARGGVVSFWDEVRWDGRPGERSIWIVKPDGREKPQAVKHVVLKGKTPLTLYRPYAVSCGKSRVPVMDMPIPLMAFQESRGDVWDKYVAKSLNMTHGVGAVVGVNNQGPLPDLVYIIVEQGPTPTTFEVVLTWHDRDVEVPLGVADQSSCATKSRRRPRAPAGALLVAADAFTASAHGADDKPALPQGVPSADKARIETVLAKASVSARVEIDPYSLRLDVLDYLLDHPDFATQVTRALKLARYRIWRDADGLHLDDGWGVTGIMTPIYGDGGLRVIYARGRYEQSVLPDINGQAVILLRYTGAPGSNGRPMLTTSMEVFAQLDSAMLASVAGSIAKSKATSEARHVLKVFSRLSTHLNLRADEILAELARRPEVLKSELEGFRKVLGR